jgi:hypothetical protein
VRSETSRVSFPMCPFCVRTVARTDNTQRWRGRSADAALLAMHVLDGLALDQLRHPVDQLLAVDLNLVERWPFGDPELAVDAREMDLDRFGRSLRVSESTPLRATVQGAAGFSQRAAGASCSWQKATPQPGQN